MSSSRLLKTVGDDNGFKKRYRQIFWQAVP